MRPLNSCLGFVSVSWRLVHNLLDVKIVFAGTFKGLTDDILVHELTRIPLKSTAHSFTSVWVFDGVVDTMWPVGLLCLLDPPPSPLSICLYYKWRSVIHPRPSSTFSRLSSPSSGSR